MPSQVTSKAAVLFITVQYNVTISSNGKIKINNGHLKKKIYIYIYRLLIEYSF